MCGRPHTNRSSLLETGPKTLPARRIVVNPFWEEMELVWWAVEQVPLTRLYALLYEEVYGIDEGMSRR